MSCFTCTTVIVIKLFSLAFIPRGGSGHIKGQSASGVGDPHSVEHGKKPSGSEHRSPPPPLAKPGSGRFAALAPGHAPPASQLLAPSGLTLLDRVKRSTANVVRYSKEQILSKHKDNPLPEYLEAFQTRANGIISEAPLTPVSLTPLDPNEVEKMWLRSAGQQRGVRQVTSHIGGSNKGVVVDKQRSGNTNKNDKDDLWDAVNGSHGDTDGGLMDLAAMAEQSGKLKEEMDRMAQRMAILDANGQKQEQEKRALGDMVTQRHEMMLRKSSDKSIEGDVVASREEDVGAHEDPATNYHAQHWAPHEATPSSAQQQVMPGQLFAPGVDAEAPSSGHDDLLSVLGISKPNVMHPPQSAEETVALRQWPIQARPPFGSLQQTTSSHLVAPPVHPHVQQHSSRSNTNTATGGGSGPQQQQQQKQQVDMQMYLQLEQQDCEQQSRVGDRRHLILEEQARQHAAVEHAQASKLAHPLAPGQHQGLMPEHQEQAGVPPCQDMPAYLGGHAQPQHQQPLRPAAPYNQFMLDQPHNLQQQQPTAIPSQQPVPWFYQDTQGQIQGPFSGQAMKSWLEAGYFAMDLPVRHGPVGEFIELCKRIAVDAEPFAEHFTEPIVPAAVSMHMQQQQQLLQTQQDEVHQERERLKWQQRERERAVALAQARVQTEQEAQQRANQKQQELLQQQQETMEHQQAQMEKQQQQLQIQRKRLQEQREHMELELAKQKERQQRSAAAASTTPSAPNAGAAETPTPPPSVPSLWGAVPLNRSEAVQPIHIIQQSALAENARAHAETARQQQQHNDAGSSQEEHSDGDRNGNSVGGPGPGPVQPSTVVWPSPPVQIPGKRHSSTSHTVAPPQPQSPPIDEVPVDSQGIPKLPSAPVSLMATANPLPGRNLSQKERRSLEKQRMNQRASEEMQQTSVRQAWGAGAGSSTAADGCDGSDGSSKELKSMLGIGQQQQAKVAWSSSKPQPKSLIEIQQEEERAAAKQANAQQSGLTARLGWASRVNPNAGAGGGMNLGLAQSSQPQQKPQPPNNIQGHWGVQRPVVHGQGQGIRGQKWPQPGGQNPKRAENHDSVPRSGEGGFWDANAATTNATTSSSVKEQSPSLSAPRETSSTNMASTASQLTSGTSREQKSQGGATGGSGNVSNFGSGGIPPEMRTWATHQLTKIRGDGGDLSLLDFLMNISVLFDSF